jgi:hypothetical protein
MTYSIGKHVFSGLAGVLAACGLAVAGSHIGYSLSAIHAIFDALFMLTALCAFVRYARSGSRSDLRWLLLADVLGFAHFYYFITVLVPQALYLFIRRRALSVPSSYFFFVCALCSIFAIPVVAGYSSTYEYGWWGRGSVANVEKLLEGLSLYQPDRPHAGLSRWLGYVLLILVLASIARTTALTLRRAANGLPMLLVGTFLLPLLLYLVGGWLDRPIGHPRTYFYLLPIYFLLIFALLEHLLKVAPRALLFSVPLLILLAISAESSLDGIYSTSPVLGVIRENRIEARQGGHVLIHDTGNLEWPSRYYLAKLHPEYEADFFKRRDDALALLEGGAVNGCQPVTVLTSDKSVAAEIEEALSGKSLPLQAHETKIEIPDWFGYSSGWADAFQVTSRVGRCSTP